jgi:hypothetical protein
MDECVGNTGMPCMIPLLADKMKGKNNRQDKEKQGWLVRERFYQIKR